MQYIPDLTQHPVAIAALAFFVLAYAMVLAEEFISLRKSKPVILAAGIIWVLVAIAWKTSGNVGVEDVLRHNLLEYAELLLFLLAAMTYVNTMEERQIFAALRSWLLAQGWSFRTLYWIAGLLAFCISPVLDNLTTALVMGTVAMSIGREERSFTVPTCISIVVGANAGGTFTPFGDVTTLMVWQKGILPFASFLALFLPALVNWLIPAAIMAFAVPAKIPPRLDSSNTLKHGALTVVLLFAATIALTVSLHQFLHLPPFLGMMTGLGALAIYGHFLRRGELAFPDRQEPPANSTRTAKPFDIFISMKRVEWDTLLFFYGVMLCVGGLGALGFLGTLSTASYAALGPGWTNILVGLASSIIDNIPVMFAVLSINPDMSSGQWLLVTLTAGVGGSLLSIGSAAGVALMGLAPGTYTFFAHLRWAWAVALGFAASIWVHYLVNANQF